MEIQVTVCCPELHELAEAIRGRMESKTAAPIAPDMPDMPTAPVAPSMPTVPATPVAPSMPAMPAAPSMPAMPAAPVAPSMPAMPAAPAPVPTTAPVYKLEDIMRAAAVIADKGKRPQVLALLSEFGVQALNQLSPERFSAFAARLRDLGGAV